MLLVVGVCFCLLIMPYAMAGEGANHIWCVGSPGAVATVVHRALPELSCKGVGFQEIKKGHQFVVLGLQSRPKFWEAMLQPNKQSSYNQQATRSSGSTSSNGGATCSSIAPTVKHSFSSKETPPNPEQKLSPCRTCGQRSSIPGEMLCQACTQVSLDVTDDGSACTPPMCDNCGNGSDGSRCGQQWLCHECQGLECMLCYDYFFIGKEICHLACGHMNVCSECLAQEGYFRCPCQSGFPLQAANSSELSLPEQSIKLGQIVQFAYRQQELMRQCKYQVTRQEVVDYYCGHQDQINEDTLDNLKLFFRDKLPVAQRQDDDHDRDEDSDDEDTDDEDTDDDDEEDDYTLCIIL